MHQKKKRNKKGKRLLAGLLAALLTVSLTACGPGTTENDSSGLSGQNKTDKESSLPAKQKVSSQAMGRWVERDVTPEGADYFSMAPAKMEDGTLVFYGKEGGRDGQLMCYTSGDGGKSWDKEELDWEETAKGKMTNYSLLTDGTVFMQIYQYDDSMEQVEQVSYWLKKSDSAQPVEVTGLEGKAGDFCMLMDADTLFVAGCDEQEGESFEIISLQTGEVLVRMKDLSTDMSGYLMGTALDLSEPENPRIYYEYYEGNEEILAAFDKKGNVEEKLAKIQAGGMKGATDPQGNYYYVSGGNICRMTKGGSIQEQIMDDDGFQLGLSSYFCTALGYVDERSFLCVLSNMDSRETKLMQYVWDESIPANAEESLTIWSLTDNASVRAAVACCKSKYPEIDITYQVGMPEEEGISEEDAIRTLQTQLIAKEGSDILIMDGLDYENLISKGALADISAMVDQAQLLQNIVKPFETEEGAVYVLPARFSVPVLMGDEGDLEGMDSLAALKEAVLAGAVRPNYDASDDAYYTPWQAEERYALGFVDLDQLMDFAMRTSATQLIQDGQVNTQALREVMDFVGSVGIHYGMDRYPAEGMSGGVAFSTDGIDVVDLSDGTSEYEMSCHARFGWDILKTPALLSSVKRNGAKEDAKADVIIQPGLVSGAYLPSTLAGMTSNSRNTEAAEKFLKVLFGEEVQNVNQQDGCPVLESALDKSIAKQADYIKEHGYDGDIKALFAELENPVTESDAVKTLRGYMKEHAGKMIAGKETLDQAVSGVESDISLMLQEQAW